MAAQLLPRKPEMVFDQQKTWLILRKWMPPYTRSHIKWKMCDWWTFRCHFNHNRMIFSQEYQNLIKVRLIPSSGSSFKVPVRLPLQSKKIPVSTSGGWKKKKKNPECECASATIQRSYDKLSCNHKESRDTRTEINISNDWLSAPLPPFSSSSCSLPVILCHLLQQIGLPVLWLPSAPAGPRQQPVPGVLPPRLLPGRPHALPPWVSPDTTCSVRQKLIFWIREVCISSNVSCALN